MAKRKKWSDLQFSFPQVLQVQAYPATHHQHQSPTVKSASPSSPLSFPSVESPYSWPPESFPFVSETFSWINLISEGVDNKISCWWLCPIVRWQICKLQTSLSNIAVTEDFSLRWHSCLTDNIIILCYQMMIILLQELHCTSRSWPTPIISQSCTQKANSQSYKTYT